MLISFVALALAAGTAAAPLALENRATCYKGVYVIGVRGSEEAPGLGSTAPVVQSVLKAIPNSGSAAVSYPASVINPLYPASVSDGVSALRGLVQQYTSACPGKVVLVGFSQGANVITDAIAGGGGAPLSADIINKRISAVTVFGDPSFTKGQSFNRGTNVASNGIFSRSGSTLQVLNNHASKLLSFCNTGDIYCASGKDHSVHGKEVSTGQALAVKFIVNNSK